MISVNIASIPTRKESLIKTIDSLIDQVDIVNVCLNNYKENPYKHKKVNVIFRDNKNGDAGKMIFLSAFEGYYFMADDDLIYPENYIKDTIKQIDKYKIVSYHGRSFLKFPIESYYKTPAIRNRCLDTYEYTEPVNIAGTGVMGFHTDYFKPPFSIVKKANMLDIWVSCYAKENNIKIWGLKHDNSYFKYQPPEDTIYDQKHLNCDYETQIVNKYFTKK